MPTHPTPITYIASLHAPLRAESHYFCKDLMKNCLVTPNFRQPLRRRNSGLTSACAEVSGRTGTTTRLLLSFGLLGAATSPLFAQTVTVNTGTTIRSDFIGGGYNIAGGLVPSNDTNSQLWNSVAAKHYSQFGRNGYTRV